ncbi:unnamed protein product [Mycena citricolor]|uniref:Uncharacterized protein n=1 Tax=Mycena citricolor TaxID=2018698 RepID=A0AAD2GYT8_9AGAR|nr:unnamed protein product [Mycena citricolor]
MDSAVRTAASTFRFASACVCDCNERGGPSPVAVLRLDPATNVIPAAPEIATARLSTAVWEKVLGVGLIGGWAGGGGSSGSSPADAECKRIGTSGTAGMTSRRLGSRILFKTGRRIAAVSALVCLMFAFLFHLPL